MKRRMESYDSGDPRKRPAKRDFIPATPSAGDAGRAERSETFIVDEDTKGADSRRPL
jgi:hypothetical protein